MKILLFATKITTASAMLMLVAPPVFGQSCGSLLKSDLVQIFKPRLENESYVNFLNRNGVKTPPNSLQILPDPSTELGRAAMKLDEGANAVLIAAPSSMPIRSADGVYINDYPLNGKRVSAVLLSGKSILDLLNGSGKDVTLEHEYVHARVSAQLLLNGNHPLQSYVFPRDRGDSLGSVLRHSLPTTIRNESPMGRRFRLSRQLQQDPYYSQFGADEMLAFFVSAARSQKLGDTLSAERHATSSLLFAFQIQELSRLALSQENLSLQQRAATRYDKKGSEFRSIIVDADIQGPAGTADPRRHLTIAQRFFFSSDRDIAVLESGDRAAIRRLVESRFKLLQSLSLEVSIPLFKYRNLLRAGASFAQTATLAADIEGIFAQYEAIAQELNSTDPLAGRMSFSQWVPHDIYQQLIVHLESSANTQEFQSHLNSAVAQDSVLVNLNEDESDFWAKEIFENRSVALFTKLNRMKTSVWLRINNAAAPRSFAAAFANAGGTHFEHKTSLSSLRGLLADGYMTSQNGVTGERFVYFTPKFNSSSQPLQPNEVRIVLPYQALDFLPWSHLNQFEAYGRRDAYSSVRDLSFYSFLTAQSNAGEIMFRDFSLSDIPHFRILVPESQKSTLIRELVEQNVVAPNGFEWDDLIVTSLVPE